MKNTRNAILSFLVSIPLLYFPGYELWKVLTEKEAIKVNSLEEFAYYCDIYECRDADKQKVMLSSFNNSQKPTLEGLQKKLHGIRYRYNKINQN